MPYFTTDEQYSRSSILSSSLLYTLYLFVCVFINLIELFKQEVILKTVLITKMVVGNHHRSIKYL